ncbi:hypothetical protein [Sphingobium subterraneum]|nr:hypothetical protein [Sphingobium subterraneum]
MARMTIKISAILGSTAHNIDQISAVVRKPVASLGDMPFWANQRQLPIILRTHRFAIKMLDLEPQSIGCGGGLKQCRVAVRVQRQQAEPCTK